MCRTRQYRIWNSLKKRCLNPRTPSYPDYGGRGITIPKKWHDFIGFWEDVKEGYRDDLSIDRIDNNKSYSKRNCKWSTQQEQASNRRDNIKFKGKTATQVSLELTNGRSSWMVYQRISAGWPIELAFTKKAGTKRKDPKGYYFLKNTKRFYVRKIGKSYKTEAEATRAVASLTTNGSQPTAE